MTESEVQTKVIAKFERSGWLVVKILQCTKNGWPDLQCHKNGETIFIECKSENKTPAPLQIYRHEELRKQGFKVLIISHPDNIII